MGDLISRLQGDRVTLWRPDVKKRHRTRAPLDQEVVPSEAAQQRRGARREAAPPRQRDAGGSGSRQLGWLLPASPAPQRRGWWGSGGWRGRRDPRAPWGAACAGARPEPRGARAQGRESPGMGWINPGSRTSPMSVVVLTPGKPLTLFPIRKPDPTSRGSSRRGDFTSN